jgi:RNA-directed DNA polymerase
MENPNTEEGGDEYLELLKEEKLPEKLAVLRQRLYQKAKNEPKFRFYTLYSHIYRDDVLQTAWRLVRRNNGAAGIDGVSLEDVQRREDGVDGFLLEIREQLRTHKYKPNPVRRVYIPKAEGGRRPLGIPTVRDRVVQAATRLILEPIFEADFLDCSYGFRPGRQAHQALAEIRGHLQQGYRSVYDMDLKGYFDSIPHDKLLACVKMRIADQAVVKLIRMWLQAPVVEEDEDGKKRITRPDKGTPQGGVISPLLANLYLHWFDKLFYRADGPAQWAKAKLIRYADDLVILAHYTGERLQHFVQDTLERRMQLSIHREKTRVVTMGGPGASFDFLGFTFRYDRDLKGRSWRYLNIVPSRTRLKRERQRLRVMTSSHMCWKPIPTLIADINHHLDCWHPYYRFGYPRAAFRAITTYARERLTLHLRRRSQRPFRPPPGVSYYEQLSHLGFRAL